MASTDLQPDFIGDLVFQSDETPRSLHSTGKIYADVDPITGGFASWVGDNSVTIPVPIYNARKHPQLNLNQNGFQFVEHNITTPIDFYDENQIISTYYPKVEEYMKMTLNAYRVFVFDHIVRNSGISNISTEGDSTVVKRHNKVGGPAFKVHGDYGLRGGPTRMHNFSKPPKIEDTFRVTYGERPLISAEIAEELKGRRFAIINLWRSFSDQPCVDMPLTFCDTQTTEKNDYATIEFRYSNDDTVETYLGGYSKGQRWYYYPSLLKNEGIFIKTYDSQGSLFVDYVDYPYRLKDQPLIPSTSVLHTAVVDPRLSAEGLEYPKRESIEVRAVVFY